MLQACRAARSAGKALFVLSSTIYAEVQKIKDPMQRRRLAEVMEELTDFSTLVSRVVVMELEFSALLDPIAKLPNPLSKAPLVGRGIRHAFGLRSGFSIMGPSGDETKSFRQRYGSRRRVCANETLNMERSILRGPVDGDDENALRALGYIPEVRLLSQRVEQNKNKSSRKYSTQTRSRGVDICTISSPLANSLLNFKTSARGLSRAPGPNGCDVGS